MDDKYLNLCEKVASVLTQVLGEVEFDDYELELIVEELRDECENEL